MSPWVPALISGAVALLGVGANLLFIGRWVGKIGAGFTNLTLVVDKLEKRIDAFEDEVDVEASHRATFVLRLENAEKAAEVLWEVRDKLTAMKAVSEVEERYSREKLDKMGREIAGIHRALANLTNVRSPIREFTAEG